MKKVILSLKSNFSSAPRLLYFVLLLAGTVACSKGKDPEPESARIVFWTSNDAINDIEVECYVDGEFIGTLNKLSSKAPSCDDSKSPVANVEPGTHECEFRADNGQIIPITVDVEAGQCQNIELL